MIVKQKYLKLILFRVNYLKTLIPIATVIIIVVEIKYACVSSNNISYSKYNKYFINYF